MQFTQREMSIFFSPHYRRCIFFFAAIFVFRSKVFLYISRLLECPSSSQGKCQIQTERRRKGSLVFSFLFSSPSSSSSPCPGSISLAVCVFSSIVSPLTDLSSTCQSSSSFFNTCHLPISDYWFRRRHCRERRQNLSFDLYHKTSHLWRTWQLIDWIEYFASFEKTFE